MCPITRNRGLDRVAIFFAGEGLWRGRAGKQQRALNETLIIDVDRRRQESPYSSIIKSHVASRYREIIISCEEERDAASRHEDEPRKIAGNSRGGERKREEEIRGGGGGGNEGENSAKANFQPTQKIDLTLVVFYDATEK